MIISSIKSNSKDRCYQFTYSIGIGTEFGCLWFYSETRMWKWQWIQFLALFCRFFHDLLVSKLKCESNSVDLFYYTNFLYILTYNKIPTRPNKFKTSTFLDWFWRALLNCPTCFQQPQLSLDSAWKQQQWTPLMDSYLLKYWNIQKLYSKGCNICFPTAQD